MMRTSRLVLKPIDASLPLSATSRFEFSSQIKENARCWYRRVALFCYDVDTSSRPETHNRHSLTIIGDARLLVYQAKNNGKARCWPPRVALFCYDADTLSHPVPIVTSSFSATPHFWIFKPKNKGKSRCWPGHLSSAVMRSFHLVLTTIDTSSPLWRNSAFGSSVGHASKTFLLLTLASDFSHDFLFASDPSGSENLDKTIVSAAKHTLHLPSP
ncbi:hypothetical protein TNCT_724481 [Trichonephila clavata]|uniref:Uncharacterized protein n=1 Tax=Trichonephila clavata TaxID=2740835 RepID=A0A8X6L8D2_TRICU|nr:hypothetical protein TNCT_724481 [Trichonephila clavata]